MTIDNFTENKELGLTREQVYEQWLLDKDKEPPVDKIIVLEHENKLLKAKVEALNMTTDFHEECLVELASIVYA